MNINDIRDKVNKLLALSASPNEAEAKAALLKAHELMGRYKLTMVDLKDDTTQEVVELRTSLTATKQKKQYVYTLSEVIARATLCRALYLRNPGARVSTVAVVGFKEDAEIAKSLLEYVARFLDNELKVMDRFYSARGMRGDAKRTRLDGYAFGFVAGIKEALDKQKDENEWGLVMVTPQEVSDHMSKYKNTKINAREMNADAYARGVRDGKRFNVNGHSNARIEDASYTATWGEPATMMA